MPVTPIIQELARAEHPIQVTLDNDGIRETVVISVTIAGQVRDFKLDGATNHDISVPGHDLRTVIITDYGAAKAGETMTVTAAPGKTGTRVLL